jgi:hypothetical protein
MHVSWAMAGGFRGPQGGDDPSAFICKYRYSHLFGIHKGTCKHSDSRKQNVSLTGRLPVSGEYQTDAI